MSDVKIYKRKDSPYWWIWYYLPDGTIERKSTKIKNKGHAKTIAKQKEEELVKNRGIKGASVTLRDLIQEVIDDYFINKKKSLNKVEQRKKSMFEFFGEDKKVNEIGIQEIGEYIKHRIEKDMQASTINRELSILNRGFTLLLEKKRIADKPKIKKLKENNIRTDFLEHWEYLKLLENASPHIVPIIRLAYKTGWRTEELTELTWEMVDIDNGIITLPPGDYTKNEEGRVYYLDNELIEMFRTMWSDRRVLKKKIPYVFLNKWKTGKMKSFKEAWKESCKRAGFERKHFHGFRRTAVRNMVRAGIPERVAMTISGHKTRSVFERYNITSLRDLQIASNKMEEYLKGESETKPEQVSKEVLRGWEKFLIPVEHEELDAEERGRPLKEILDEIAHEAQKREDRRPFKEIIAEIVEEYKKQREHGKID